MTPIENDEIDEYSRRIDLKEKKKSLEYVEEFEDIW